MIQNIIDRRERKHRWKLITAIIEPTWHDNSHQDADQAEEIDAPDYDERSSISLADAVVWAQAQPFAVTLFLYDAGKGTNVVRVPKFQH